jgi:signal transduction histidine kinase
LRAQQVDAHALVEGALARFRALHPARVVTTTAPSTPILIEVDAGLVRRVIENLLDNGHKHSPPERPLALALSSAGGRARFQVADQGEGIAPEDLPHVFDPFFRADRSRARASGGAGLGLPLARRVVEAHGGTITIESQPGQGTTVTFELPPG